MRRALDIGSLLLVPVALLALVAAVYIVALYELGAWLVGWRRR